MKDNPSLGVVIPVYNEEPHIARLLQDWQDAFNKIPVSCRFIIINDGSTDGSADILRKVAANPGAGTYPIHHEIDVHSKTNAGHGPAILDGYRMAVACEWVFQLDSDHQLDPGAFNLLWENRDRYDLLLAERKEKNASLTRKALSFVSRISVRLFYGKGASDVNSPYRLMRSSRLKEALTKIPGNSFAPNILLTAWFIFSKARIFTLGVGLRKEGPGETAGSAPGQHPSTLIRKSKMNTYFLKGSIRALFQTIQFRFRL